MNPYPYTIQNFCTITGTTATNPSSYYYFFYNWVYTEIPCNTSRTEVIGTDTCFVGLNDLFAGGGLEVYPNPTSGKFEVKFNTEDAMNFTVRITDPIGKNFVSENFEKFSGEFKRSYDLSKLAKGIYLLEIKSGDKSVSKKIMVQ